MRLLCLWKGYSISLNHTLYHHDCCDCEMQRALFNHMQPDPLLPSVSPSSDSIGPNRARAKGWNQVFKESEQRDGSICSDCLWLNICSDLLCHYSHQYYISIMMSLQSSSLYLNGKLRVQNNSKTTDMFVDLEYPEAYYIHTMCFAIGLNCCDTIATSSYGYSTIFASAVTSNQCVYDTFRRSAKPLYDI